MPKLGDFKTPTGATGNVFSLGSWAELILGAIVLLLTFATGQKMVQAIPSNKVLDTSIEPVFNSPTTANTIEVF
ncbi:MAG: hypothetical protein VB085_08840 [Peptococcaceae bacterium]|nr:hypothetical protein [Peptococcaceae bacterium]